MYFSRTSFFSFIAVFGLVKAQSKFTGEATLYQPGPEVGTCGHSSTEFDLIAALNGPQYDADGGSDCDRSIRIFYQGKSVDVTIVDRCGGCLETGDLDLSLAAFSALSPPQVGRIPISWQYI